jgi:hypothetical protein
MASDFGRGRALRGQRLFLAAARRGNDITKQSEFLGGSLFKPKPILRTGVSGHAADRLIIILASAKKKNYFIVPAFDAMRAAWPTMKQPQIQRSRV